MLSIIYLAKLLASHKPFILKIVAIGITVEFVLTCAREYEECNMLRCDDAEQKYKSKLLFFSKLWLGIKPNLLLGLLFGLLLIKFMQVVKIILRDILLGIL